MELDWGWGRLVQLQHQQDVSTGNIGCERKPASTGISLSFREFGFGPGRDTLLSRALLRASERNPGRLVFQLVHSKKP